MSENRWDTYCDEVPFDDDGSCASDDDHELDYRNVEADTDAESHDSDGSTHFPNDEINEQAASESNIFL